MRRVLGDTPAMPHTEYDADGNMPKGLTKREYFAGLAMQGILANHEAGHEGEIEFIPHDAVTYADALLAELEQTE